MRHGTRSIAWTGLTLFLLAAAPAAAATTQVFLYDGTSTVQFTNNANRNHSPDINNGTAIAWVADILSPFSMYQDIFVSYDLKNQVNVTQGAFPYDYRLPTMTLFGFAFWVGHNGYADDPIYACHPWIAGNAPIQLTTHGTGSGGWLAEHRVYDVNLWAQMAWSSGLGSGAEIYFWDLGGEKRITNNSIMDVDPDINGQGQIVWIGCASLLADCEVYQYDGATVKQLTPSTDGIEHWDARINDAGQIVTLGLIQKPAGGWNFSDWEIYTWDAKAGLTNISNNPNGDGLPVINEQGWIAWPAGDGTDHEIRLYDPAKKSVAQITQNGYADRNVQINNSHQLAWEGEAGAGGARQIFLYDWTSRASPKNISAGTFDQRNPRLSDAGLVVWEGDPP